MEFTLRPGGLLPTCSPDGGRRRGFPRCRGPCVIGALGRGDRVGAFGGSGGCLFHVPADDFVDSSAGICPVHRARRYVDSLNSFPPTGSDRVLSPHDYALVDLRSSQENLLTGGSVCLSSADPYRDADVMT